MARTVEDVLASARQVLENALLGESDFVAGKDRLIAGLYNAVSSGRSVTFVIQNLRSAVPDFDEWYAPIQAQLRADPVAKHFHDLRNRIEKEGTHGQSISTLMFNGNLGEIMRDAPPGTVSAFVGDPLGRSGWEVELPDGSMTVVYFTLPESLGSVVMSVDGAPDDRGMADLLREWLSSTEAVYYSAVDRFAPHRADLKVVSRPPA